MKKFLANSFLVAFSIGILFFIILKNKEEPTKNRMFPGWEKQWFEMKKNEFGIIPSGMYSKWHKADLENAKRFTYRTSELIESITELGPFNVGGRTRALLVDRGNSNKLFAGAISGGLWVSTNRGANWTALNDHSPNLSVSCITQSPFEYNKIYYGTGESRANSADVPGEGVFMSLDGGATFTQLASTIINSHFAYIWAIKHSETDSNTLYVGTNDGGLYRTVNSGLTWERVFSLNRVTDIEVFPDGSVIAARQFDGLYYSPNGNSGTFTKIQSNLRQSSNYRIEVEKCESFPSVVYAAFENSSGAGVNAFYKSSDGGKTWVATAAVPNVESTYQAYCLVLGVHPSDTNKVLCAGVRPRYSNNGGATWLNAKDSHADYHSFAFHPSLPNEFYLGNDGGVHRYTWTSPSTSVNLCNTYHVTQFYAGNFFPSGLNYLGGTQDNGTHRRLSGATSQVYHSDGGYAHVSQQNPNKGYQERQYGEIRVSNNLQAAIPSFSAIYSGITDSKPFIMPYEMNMANDSQIIALASAGVWVTVNSGNKWTKLSSRGNLYALALTEDVYKPTVYYGGSNNRLIRYDNIYETNQEINLSATAPPTHLNDYLGGISIHPFDKTTIYVCYTNYSDRAKIFRVDSANTQSPVWKNISGNLPQGLPVNMVQAHPQDDRKLFAATDFGLYCSSDGGETWIKETTMPNVAIHQLRLRKSDLSLFAFTHGRGVWHIQLKPHEWPLVVPKINTSEPLNLGVYPNPITDKFFVRVSTNGLQKIEWFGLDGKLITRQYAFAENKVLLLYANEFTNGSYLLRIEGEDKVIRNYRVQVAN